MKMGQNLKRKCSPHNLLIYMYKSLIVVASEIKRRSFKSHLLCNKFAKLEKKKSFSLNYHIEPKSLCYHV